MALAAIAWSASAWAQPPLKVAGQDVPPWAVHERGSSALTGVFVDLTNAIAKDAGLPTAYRDLADLKNIPVGVQKGSIQLGLRIVSSYQSPSPIPRVGIAVRKGDSELLGKINRSLAKLEADGTVKAIFVKYGVDDWAPPK